MQSNASLTSNPSASLTIKMVGGGCDVQKLPVVQKSRQKHTKSTPLSMHIQFLTNDRHVYDGIDLIIFIL